MDESNWERCQRLAREIDKDRLIRDLLVQIAKMRKPRERSLPLWSFVGDATNHGSGVSCGICSIYGVNSDTGKLVETPERNPERKPGQPAASQPTPNHSDDAENAGSGDNSTGTDGRTIIKIENSPSEADCGTSHGDQELAKNEGAESPAPERNRERKSPLPTPSETPR